MTEIRDWSVTASANTGTVANGFFPDAMKYSEVNNAARAMQAIEARYFADRNGTVVDTGKTNSAAISFNADQPNLVKGDHFLYESIARNDGVWNLTISDSPTYAIRYPNPGFFVREGATYLGGTYELYAYSASGTVSAQILNPLTWFNAPGLPESPTSVISTAAYLTVDAGTLKHTSMIHLAKHGEETSGPSLFLAAEKNGVKVYTGSTSTDAWTIDNGLGSPGTTITVINNGSSDGPTLTAGTATLDSASGDLVVEQNGVAILYHAATNVWKATGDLTT